MGSIPAEQRLIHQEAQVIQESQTPSVQPHVEDSIIVQMQEPCHAAPNHTRCRPCRCCCRCCSCSCWRQGTTGGVGPCAPGLHLPLRPQPLLLHGGVGGPHRAVLLLLGAYRAVPRPAGCYAAAVAGQGLGAVGLLQRPQALAQGAVGGVGYGAPHHSPPSRARGDMAPTWHSHRDHRRRRPHTCRHVCWVHMMTMVVVTTRGAAQPSLPPAS